MKLTIELVPKTCWFSNIRNHVSQKTWKEIQQYTFKKAGYVCEICEGKGNKHPVECHEIWNYNDKKKIQTLERTIALCPACHEVKHIGFAESRGRLDIAKKHFKKINECSEEKAFQYISNAFYVWRERSQYNWKLNIDWLNENFDLNIKSER